MKTMESHSIVFKSATPQFTVPDLVRTGEYYRDVLGFEIAGYWDGEQVTLTPDTPPVFAIVHRDNVQIFFSLADNSDVRRDRSTVGYDAFFQIIGVDALARELRTRNADIVDGPEIRVYQQRELVVKDCNGLVLCFAENTSSHAN